MPIATLGQRNRRVRQSTKRFLYISKQQPFSVGGTWCSYKATADVMPTCSRAPVGRISCRVASRRVGGYTYSSGTVTVAHGATVLSDFTHFADHQNRLSVRGSPLFLNQAQHGSSVRGIGRRTPTLSTTGLCSFVLPLSGVKRGESLHFKYCSWSQLAQHSTKP